MLVNISSVAKELPRLFVFNEEKDGGSEWQRKESNEKLKVIFMHRSAEIASFRSGPLFGSQIVYTTGRI